MVIYTFNLTVSTPLQTFKDSKHIAIEKNHGNVLETSDSAIGYDMAA